MDGNGQINSSAALTPGKNAGAHWMGWVSHRSGLEVLGKGNTFPCRVSNPGLPPRSLVTVRTHCLSSRLNGSAVCIWYDIYDMIYLLAAIGLSPGGSSTVHIYTQTVHRTQITTNLEECGPCPVFASFTLAFALQLREKHGKTSVRVRKTSVRLRKLQSTVYILPKHTHITKPTQTHTLQNPHTHTHTQTHYKTI